MNTDYHKYMLNIGFKPVIFIINIEMVGPCTVVNIYLQ